MNACGTAVHVYVPGFDNNLKSESTWGAGPRGHRFRGPPFCGLRD